MAGGEDASGPNRAVAALVALAKQLDGGDPLRDEPASIFSPLDPHDGDAEAGPEAPAR